MTIGCLGFDGFESGDTSFWTLGGDQGVTVQTDYHRGGDYGGKLEDYKDTPFYDATGAVVATATPYIRLDCLVTALPSANRTLYSFQGIAVASLQPTGKISVSLVDGGGVDSTFVVTPFVGFRVDLRAWMNSENHASFQVRINADEVVELLDVDVGSNLTYNYFRLGSSGTDYQWYFDDANCYVDDYYACDDGWPPEGECSKRNTPTGIGYYDTFTSSVPDDKYLDVDEWPANDDTDYIYNTGNVQREQFTHDGTGGYKGASVRNAVVCWGRAKTLALLGRYIQCRSGTTNITSAVSTSQTYVWGPPLIRALDPATGVAWTEDGIDDFQIGVYVGTYGAGPCKLTAITALVDFLGTSTWPKFAFLTGTAVPTMIQADVVAGGETIIITAGNDTWVTGAAFDAQRQAIINGLDSAQSEAHGWNAEVKAKIPVTDVVRTSDTVVTITLTAETGYFITATETITCTVPAAALVGGGTLVATPTFAVTVNYSDDQIDASSDDAWQQESTGVMNLTGDEIIINSSAVAGSRSWGGLRWNNGPFPPKGSTVIAAYFTGYVHGNDDANFDIFGIDAAGPTTFTATDFDITNRTLTSASVSWVADSLGVGWVQSPSIVAVIQELVDSYTVSGITLVLKPKTDIAKSLIIYSWDWPDHLLGAKLHIEWYVPAPGGNIAEINGVKWEHVAEVNGVAEANISEVSGVQAN